MTRWFKVAILGLFAAGGGLWLTAPSALPGDTFAGLTADPERGATVFAIAGCASCHTAPDAAWSETPLLSGGKRFVSPFGTFIAPNISTDPVAGIGAWTDVEIASAIQRGVGRENRHLFPAFPYTTYARATAQDVLDLVAHLKTLPADPTPNQPHEVGFPFNIRASLGGWKLLFASGNWPSGAPESRGRYLVEALGHCGECHTPRNILGGLDTSRWLMGAPNPSGKGTIPGITPAGLDWSESDIAVYLTTGFTPEFDTAGGEMAEVVKNLAQLPEADILAIVAYLKSL